MTDRVHPSFNEDADSFEVAQTIYYSVGSDGWIKDSASPTQMARDDASLTNGNFDEFSESHSASSFDVTINAGEGFVKGAWVARDGSTTVTLDASTNNQTVYLGYDIDQGNTVIIGKSGDFTSVDSKIPIWDFDTDGSGVTASTDRRNIGRTWSLGDDEFFSFGDDGDFDIGYDATADQFQLIDGVNNTDLLYGNKNGGIEIVNGNLKMASNIIPDSAGTRNVGTSTTHFNEMHATQFTTHSPEPRSLTEAYESITSYAKEYGSMEMGEMIADLVTLVEKQEQRISNLEAQL